MDVEYSGRAPVPKGSTGVMEGDGVVTWWFRRGCDHMLCERLNDGISSLCMHERPSSSLYGNWVVSGVLVLVVVVVVVVVSHLQWYGGILGGALTLRAMMTMLF